MDDLKFYFESTEENQSFLSDTFSSSAVIETVYVDNLDISYNGFTIFLIDKELDIRMKIIKIDESKTDLLIKLSKKQQLEIVSNGSGKILLQGKLY